jgi:hypothetical protein
MKGMNAPEEQQQVASLKVVTFQEDVFNQAKGQPTLEKREKWLK